MSPTSYQAALSRNRGGESRQQANLGQLADELRVLAFLLRLRVYSHPLQRRLSQGKPTKEQTTRMCIDAGHTCNPEAIKVLS